MLGACSLAVGCNLSGGPPSQAQEAQAQEALTSAADRAADAKRAFALQAALESPQPALVVQNDFIQIAESVDDAAGFEGRYTLGNLEGDPAEPSDDNQILMYGHPVPWSSFTTVRVDGTDVVFGDTVAGTFTQPPTVYGTYLKSVWSTATTQVTEVVSLVENPSTGRMDAMQVRYMLVNIDPSHNHSVGLRVLLDTMLAANDGAPFQVPGVGAVMTEREFVGSAIPDYWQAFDSLQHPSVISQQTLRGGDATVPDRLLLVSWPDFFDTRWDYAPTPDKMFGRPDYQDSSVGLYWNPKTLGPSQMIEYVTYYGLSGLSQSMLPPLAVSVYAPLRLDIADAAYTPNPFTVTAYVQDLTADTIGGITARIDLPAGLSLQGGSATQTIGSLAPNQMRSLSWQVQAASQSVATTLPYTIAVSAPGLDDRQVGRSVEVPALLTIYDTGFQPNPEGYQFQNFGLDNLSWDLFRATYGADEVEVYGQHRPRADSFYTYGYTHVGRGGSCFGMAASDLVLFQGGRDGIYLGPTRTNLLDNVGEFFTDGNGNGVYDAGEAFTDVNGNGAWDSVRAWFGLPGFLATPQDWVEYYHPRQLDAAVGAQLGVSCSGTCAYEALRERIASGEWAGNPMVLAMWWHVQVGTQVQTYGHAVTPFRLEEAADHRQADIRIYDNNFPNVTKTVHIDLTMGVASDADYSNALDEIRVVDLLAIEAEPQMADYDVVSAGAHLLYTDSSGRQLGYVGDRLKDEIPGARPVRLLEQTAGAAMPEAYWIGDLDLRREVHGVAAGPASVSVSHPSGLAVVELLASPGSVDQVRVAPNASLLEVISAAGSASVSLSLDAETTDYARRVTFDGFRLEGGHPVTQLFGAGLASAAFVNSGSPKNVQLKLEQIGVSPGVYAHPSAISVTANTTAWVTPHDWSDLSNTYVQIDQDVGSDGTIDRTQITTTLRADVVIEPNPIPLQSQGRDVTCFLELPSGYNVAAIVPGTVRIVTVQGRWLASPIAATGPTSIGDHDGNGIPDRMVKFPRRALASALTPGPAEIGVLGQLANGRYWSGSAKVTAMSH